MTAIPAGYMKDGQGRLIPIETIRPIDLARNDLVNAIVDKARTLNDQLKVFKNGMFDDIQAFVELSAEQYGATLGGKKGNVTLVSFDGKYKVLRAVDDHIVFDERLQAAKALVDLCLVDWTANAGPELRAIVDRAFEVDQAGKINTGRVLALRRVEITDERWKQAMLAISDSIMVVGSKSYVRIYERVGNTDRYEPIALNMASA